MKPRNVILLLTLLVVAALALLVSRIDCQPDDPTGHRRVFTDLDATIQTLTIEPAQGQAVALENIVGAPTVRVATGLTVPAEPAKARGLGERLQDLSYTRRFDPAAEDGLGDSQTGLDQPRVTVTFTDSRGQNHRLLVGRQAPRVGTDLVETYVRPGSSTDTFVVAGDLHELLAAKAVDLIDLSILAVPAENIRELTVTGTERYTLSKRDGQWRLIDPVDAPADAAAVGTLLSRLANLRGRNVAALLSETGDAAIYGLDTPQQRSVRIDITAVDDSDTPEPVILRLGQAPGNIDGGMAYANVLGHEPVYAISTSLIADLTPTLDAVRSRRLVHLTPDDIAEITLTQQDKTFTLRRQDDGWQILSPVQHAADAQAVSDLLRVLSRLEADRWMTGVGEIEFSNPAAVLLVTPSTPDGEAVKLTVGRTAPDGKNYIVETKAAQAPALVPVEATEKLLAGYEAYWPRELTKLPADAVADRMVLRRDEDVIELERLAGGYWRQNRPEPADANTDRCEAIVSRLRNLQAQRIVNVGESLPQRFAATDEKVHVVLTVRLPGQSGEPADTRKVALTLARNDGTCHAWTTDDQHRVLLGEVPCDLYDLLVGDVQAPPTPSAEADLDLPELPDDFEMPAPVAPQP